MTSANGFGKQVSARGNRDAGEYRNKDMNGHDIFIWTDGVVLRRHIDRHGTGRLAIKPRQRVAGARLSIAGGDGATDAG